MRGLHALKMNKNTASSGISLSVKRLRETIKKTEKMLTDFNVKRLPSYELGWEQGIQDGIQQRKEQEQRSRLTIASELIGELPDQRIAELFDLPLTIVQTLHTEKP